MRKLMILLILAMLLLCGCQKDSAPAPQQPAPQTQELYLNVEGSLYRGDPETVLPRTPEADGSYMITFAFGGNQQRLKVTAAVLEKGLDMHDIVGLIIDEAGTVTDFKTVEECTGGYAVKNYYVDSVEGLTVHCNNSPSFDGYEKTITLNDSTQIIRTGSTDVLAGTYTTIDVNDQITAICDTNGSITHVFTEPLREIPDIYWSLERKYDSSLKTTSRQPNDLGIYEFQFAVNEQIVTLKTRDQATATKIDAVPARCVALTFDEEGFIDTVTSAYNACGGSFGSWYHITQLQDQVIFAHKYTAGSEQGSSGNAIKAKDFVAYDVSGIGPMGAKTELRVGDQVHCLVNRRGQVVIAYVISRLVDTDVYWNVDRHYNKTTKQTTRRPDKDGWYHILLAVNGQQVTLKTQDKAIVNSMDGRNDKHFALEVDGDVITAFHKPAAPSGGSYFASWSYVTEITERGVVTALKDANSQPAMAKMAENCKIYNVSSNHISFVGEETTLRVGDQIHGERNLDGELVLIYVVGGRLANSPMYWNIDRKWDSEKGESSRQPDEEGWYTLLLATEGKQVTVRTKDKTLVNEMEKSAAAAFGLSLSGDVVKKVYAPKQVAGGSGWSSWCDVTEITKGGLVTTKRVLSGDNQGETYSKYMDWNCKIYNVSNTYTSHKGEEATLWIGDRVQCYLDKEGDIEYIYIISRNPTDDHPDHFHCLCGGSAPVGHSCTEDTGWTPWTNPRSLPTKGNWYLMTDVTMTEALSIPAGSSLRLCLNGHTINGHSSGTLSMFRVNGQLTITDCQPEQGHIIANTVAYGGVIYQFDSSDTTVELYGGHLSSSLTSQERNGGIVYMGDKGTGRAVFNMYGGSITGLEITSGRGGTVKITKNQEFNLYGGTISGGNAPSGGNIDLTGTLNIYGGTIKGGAAGDKGGNIYMASGTLKIAGGTICGGSAVNYGGNMDIVKGTLTMTGGTVTGGSSKTAGGIRIQKEAVLNMYDGAIISDSYATSESGNLQINTGATFNMYGGTITGGGQKDGSAVTNNGGNVNVYGTMNMYGGTVENGYARSQGGNIAGYGSFILNIEGSAKVRGGSAPTGGNIVLRGTAPVLNMNGGSITEGEVCVSVGNVRLSGAVEITKLHLAGGALSAENLNSTSCVYISMQSPGTFLYGAEEAFLSIFKSYSDLYEVIFEGDTLKLKGV